MKEKKNTYLLLRSIYIFLSIRYIMEKIVNIFPAGKPADKTMSGPVQKIFSNAKNHSTIPKYYHRLERIRCHHFTKFTYTTLHLL